MTKEKKNFERMLTSVAGYPIYMSDLSWQVSACRGDNSNTYWHSDTMAPIVKGYISLNKIDKFSSPFEAVGGSTKIQFKSILYSEFARYRKPGDSYSARVYSTKVLDKINSMNKESLEGNAFKLLICDTSCCHRKAPTKSDKARILLQFSVKRHSGWERIKRAAFGSA